VVPWILPRDQRSHKSHEAIVVAPCSFGGMAAEIMLVTILKGIDKMNKAIARLYVAY
jgi:hypothetical protein